MAEILLTAVIHKSALILGDLLVQGGTRLYWLKEDIDWLHREMRHIRSYIDDAKDKGIGGDSGVKNLLKDIQELAGDVEDLLDEFLPRIQKSNKCKTAVCFIRTACIPCASFSSEIEKIKRRVEDIDRVRKTYNITETSNNNCIPLEQRILSFKADETEVIGLDDDFNMLRDKLLDRNLPYGVVSIVGMPGLGKTTLAKKLYRDVCGQFECSGLVHVSQQPKVGEILQDIAKQVGVKEEDRKDNLEVNLRSFLKENRYVILLDDIWDVETWNHLKPVFPGRDSKFGSRIIITSRKSDVGRYIGDGSSLHELKPLDFKNSFELFTKNIFIFDNNDNWANASSDLVNIGRNIVKRCGGIPLAIVVTAGMLRAKERTERAWNRVLESMRHKIQDECTEILAQSYNDLPVELRPCFLYFGLYPEDHEIRAFDLTNTWIAEKLIVVSSGNRREAEDLAEDFLNDLVSRNLIQVARRTYDGRISSCRIHDLLHSLCVELAKESNFFHTEHNAFDDPLNIARMRRITFYSDDDCMQEFFRLNRKPKKLRALFCFTKHPCIFSQMAHLDFKFLQVLVVDVPYDYYVRIPKKIGNMSCLRYLRLRGLAGVQLPISSGKHIETVAIERCDMLFPFVVWESKQLRHLVNNDGSFSIIPKMYSWPSNNLQTFMWVRDQYFEPRFWQGLSKLRKLGINEVSDSTINMLSASSPMSETLEVLKLNFSREPSEQLNLSSYPNIAKLHVYTYGGILLNIEAFPPNLVKLTLVSFMVDGHLLAMLKKLPKLRILKMVRCKHNEEKMDLSCEANGDSFPQLELLHIYQPYQLSKVTCRDDVSMPKLKKILLVQPFSPIRLPERLAKLTIF